MHAVCSCPTPSRLARWIVARQTYSDTMALTSMLARRDGRDHYRSVMSALMVGGGVRGGRAIGATDATGTSIVDPGWKRGRPIYVEDITSTIYSAMGIDWTKALDNVLEGRRYYYVLGAAENSFGPVEEVFA